MNKNYIQETVDARSSSFGLSFSLTAGCPKKCPHVSTCWHSKFDKPEFDTPENDQPEPDQPEFDQKEVVETENDHTE